MNRLQKDVKFYMIYCDYLANPYGRGAGVAPTAMIKDVVERSLEEDYPDRINVTPVKTEDRQLIFMCQLPSRTKKGIYYDVVIQLDLTAVDDNVRIGINRVPFKVFSNSPSFYYTYAKVFEDKSLFCDWLKRKYERKILRKAPVTRNPSFIVGYERTVYTCMYYILQKYRHSSAIEIFQKAPLTTYRLLAKNVQSQDEIEDAYERAPYVAKIQKKKDEAARKREEHKEKMEKIRKDPASSPHTKTTPTTAKSKSTAKSKKSSFISKIKKIGRR